MTADEAQGDDASPVLVMLAGGMAKRYGGCKPLAPVGLHGEAVIDLNASDALAAGFAEVVVVVGPQTGPAIRYHVEQVWPGWATVHLAEQPVPLGTAHAALCAHRHVGDRPFAVVNADDVYGVPALGELVAGLRAGDHALVSYQLADTIVTDDPVTRGTLRASEDGWLTGIDERRLVTRHGDGHYRSGDGRLPEELDAGTPVSMNLWGFQPTMWAVLEEAVLAVHPTVGRHGAVAEDGRNSEAEVLLPEVVSDAVAEQGLRVRVVAGEGRCIGVTHADDLPVVRGELAVMVGEGLRAAGPWRRAG
ncbi:MAG TPA: NTP transferase domain-containing protein [Acidimicrobiales bacterium]|nr:NTP transferase domain-containing protein [Acidimicrobiales bacterium]